MTACVNKKHTRRVALAISASLVGALSLGAAAPAAAFAAEGIEAQSVTGTGAFKTAELVSAVDIDGKSIDIPAGGQITFTADGKPQAAIPESFAIADGEVTVKVDLNDTSSYKVEFFAANDDFTISGAAISTPVAVGKYVTRLTYLGSDYSGATIDLPFEIKAAEIGDLTAVDTEDGTFEFDGNDQLDHIAYKKGDKLLDTSMFTIKEVYKIGASFDTQVSSDAIWVGKYSIVLEGNPGTIYAGSQTEVQFEVTPLDLTKANIVVEDDVISNMVSGSNYTPTIKSINGDNNPILLARVALTFKSGPRDSGLVWHTGEYTYTASAGTVGGQLTDQVTGEKEVHFNAVDAMVTNFLYQGSPFANLTINTGLGQSFTPDKIAVFDATGKQLVAGTDYTVTAYNKNTGETTTDLSKVNTPGTWVVTAQIDAKHSEYTIGGKAEFTVTTIKGVVDTDANLYFVYGGKIVNSGVTVEYDGTDKLDDLQVIVTDTFGNRLVEGEDYRVVVKDKAGNVVTEAVNAGLYSGDVYTVTVESDAYTINWAGDTTGQNQLTIDIDPIEVKEVRAAASNFLHADSDHVLPYTGSAINPVIEYKASDGTWKTLPSSLYTLTYTFSEPYVGPYEKVDEMKEAGYYKAYLHAVRDNDTNWDLSGAAGSKGFIQVRSQYDKNDVFKVSDQKVFADVENTFWGAQGIFDAVDLGYMSGYKGTTFFGPLDHLTRAQAAVVLYNMGTGRSVPETSTLHVSWVERGLAFPDAEQWYAAELGWATQVGVVEGYPDGNYGGADEITREQFAIMLRNYAAAKGEDVTVDDVDAALEGVKDADTISDWAREAVAWAVENGVMGAEGYVYADQPIERAQAALMVTRYQPEKLSKDDYLIGNVK